MPEGASAGASRAGAASAANGSAVNGGAASASGGVGFALLAYGTWGVFPIYWRQLRHIPSLEVLSHRVVWSCVLVAGLLAVRGELRSAFGVLASGRNRRFLGASTLLIAINWFLFIWAVSGGHILQASLGYYINPLVNVALGRLVLGERLTRPAMAAVGLAAAGVTLLAAGTGAVPWVSLVLATTFGLYGLCRKMAPVGPLAGLAVETALTAPIAMVVLVVLASRGQAVSLSADLTSWGFLIGSGVATAIPLLAFAEAARRLRYATLGIVQYVAPTLQFACAVALYGEPFTRSHALAFGCIWTAVAVYVTDTLWRAHRASATAARR